MTIFLIILVLILLVLIFRLFIGINEGFQNQDLKETTKQGYTNFLAFYNPFCANWHKTIQSSVAAEIPQQPLTNPSQVSSSSAPDISEVDMNNYITQLSQQISQPLPPICKVLPSTIDINSLPNIITQMPLSTQPFINALNWMNNQLQKAQANLGDALKGSTLNGSEHFEDMCQNMSTCLANNPQLVKQLADELSGQKLKQQEYQQEQLMRLINPFLTVPELLQAFSQNKLLVQKAQDIQNQAQSGELIDKINIPDVEIKYQKPSGANNLIDIKQNNPNRYNELQQNYGQWFSIKKTLDQINAAL